MNSRNKGASGERELAHVLEQYGIDARRGQQFSGLMGDADVIGLDGIHIECKRVEKININRAMEQSIRDAEAESIRKGREIMPVVMHRRNRKPWMVTMLLDDFMRLRERS